MISMAMIAYRMYLALIPPLFYDWSNIIDVHNQTFNYDLVLNIFWLNHKMVCLNSYFYFITTVFGINVAGVWKAFGFYLPGNVSNKNITTHHSSSNICKEILENIYDYLCPEYVTLNLHFLGPLMGNHGSHKSNCPIASVPGENPAIKMVGLV